MGIKPEDEAAIDAGEAAEEKWIADYIEEHGGAAKANVQTMKGLTELGRRIIAQNEGKPLDEQAVIFYNWAKADPVAKRTLAVWGARSFIQLIHKARTTLKKLPPEGNA